MNVSLAPPPRLAILWAAGADVAVIFRRGPSKRVEVIRWDTVRDHFERGHWFHGRLYPRRSDLSPDGELLVYFASKFNRHTIADREYTYAWTAVSRPPWLTALALWPKGDCWHGGGLFRGNRALLLNHRPSAAGAHPKHQPSMLNVVSNPDASGEDEPIYARRLDREGWMIRQEWHYDFKYPELFHTSQPELRMRHRFAEVREPSVVLERRIDGLRYRERFRVEGTTKPVLPPAKNVDWVDWDHRGRLIVLGDGQVWAADIKHQNAEAFRLLADFRADKPEQREPPPAAQRW
jgi:hypothetical protein